MSKIIDLIIYKLLQLKGDTNMMAMFLAQRVILGTTKFADIPEVLKPLVLEILNESGLGFLAE